MQKSLPGRGCFPQRERGAFRPSLFSFESKNRKQWSALSRRSQEFQSYPGSQDLFEGCHQHVSNSFLSLLLLRPVPTRVPGYLDRRWTVQIPRSGSFAREQVVAKSAMGVSKAQIARELEISRNTVQRILNEAELSSLVDQGKSSLYECIPEAA